MDTTRREKGNGDGILGAQQAPIRNSRRSEQNRWRRSNNEGNNKRKIPSTVSRGPAPEDAELSAGTKTRSGWCPGQAPELSPQALPEPLGICPGGHGREEMQKALARLPSQQNNQRYGKVQDSWHCPGRPEQL